MTNRAWHLMSRPNGLPTMDNFALKEAPLPELQDGWVRVENEWLSVDPYMRGRMNDVKSYTPALRARRADAGRRGRQGRREPLARAQGGRHRPPHARLARGGGGAGGGVQQGCRRMPVEDHQWLGNLGLTGGTAYFGLLRVAEAKEGDIVFVSAAAGAVGSAVVQIAKAKGMTVIGSAGGADKCAWVRELGADAAIDYKAGPVAEAADGGRAQGHRRLFRQCRRRPSRRRLRHRAPERPLRDLRHDRRLQHGLQPRLPLHHADHRRTDHAEGLHLHSIIWPRWASSTATWAA